MFLGQYIGLDSFRSAYWNCSILILKQWWHLVLDVVCVKTFFDMVWIFIPDAQHLLLYPFARYLIRQRTARKHSSVFGHSLQPKCSTLIFDGVGFLIHGKIRFCSKFSNIIKVCFIHNKNNKPLGLRPGSQTVSPLCEMWYFLYFTSVFERNLISFQWSFGWYSF